MFDIREWLVRHNFEHERDYHFVKFRKRHWNHAEVVAMLPDPLEREAALRAFWIQDAEKRFAEYQAAVAGVSISELQIEQEQWIERLDCLGMLEYLKALAEAVHHPANDNDAGLTDEPAITA
jgi:hypothetical protein